MQLVDSTTLKTALMVIFLVTLLLTLSACAPKRPAKVDEIGATGSRSSTQIFKPSTKTSDLNTHKVVKGDSLYSIGFRYQKDYKTLATINNISPPYRIYPNQIIKLTGTISKPATTVVFKPSDSVVDNGVVTTQPISTNQPLTAQSEPVVETPKKPTIKPQTSNQEAINNQTANKPTIKKPVVNTPAKNPDKSTNKPVTQKPKKTAVVALPAPKKSLPVTTPNNTNLKWLWPTNGKIRSTFLASNPARKGISIGGKEGQDVKAAEAGVVVYSGNGLLGYGELIIIKHNASYLSAYGHNKSLKVKEGQSVTRGQNIAELGSSGTNVNNLHFEIRKNGKPVNPLNYVKP